MSNLLDCIIEESYVEEKQMSEEEIIRLNYETSYPEDWVDDTIMINAFYLGEMKVNPEKEKKDGGTYFSSKCVLQCYSDDQEVKLPFFIENFRDYNPETDTLVVTGRNPLARLIRKLKGNTNNNRFVVKYEILREIINETTDMPISVEEVVQINGYKDYTIR